MLMNNLKKKALKKWKRQRIRWNEWKQEPLKLYNVKSGCCKQWIKWFMNVLVWKGENIIFKFLVIETIEVRLCRLYSTLYPPFHDKYNVYEILYDKITRANLGFHVLSTNE